MDISTENLLKAFAHGGLGGIGGFLFGLAVQAIATAGKVKGLGVPVKYILPVFTIGAIILGFASYFKKE